MYPRLRRFIVGFIDICHIPFAKFIPTQTFRYLACGGSNTVLNWVLYSLSFNNLLHRADTHLAEGINISARVVAYVISYSISFPIGFILSRHIVFPESNLHGRVQLFRYALVQVFFILFTVVLIRFFAVALPYVRADISYIFVMFIISVLSYLSLRFFTFKVKD